MNSLILKLGATGDVVRTTTLLRRLGGNVTWVTAAKNASLLEGLSSGVRCLSWEQREAVCQTDYDLLINLEDTMECGEFATRVKHKQLFGAYLDPEKGLQYTKDSRGWFDLSLISRYGKQRADELKYLNRRTYQDLLFEGLGMNFSGEDYVLPKGTDKGLRGDIAISPVAGPVWPMKAWAYYDALQNELETRGLKVNVLPTRATLLEHLGDVQGHRCLVSGDSLPMHLALGSGIKCVSIFTCTSPWEIFDYGLQTKLVSPLLGKYFYKRDFVSEATEAISLKETLDAVLAKLK